MKIYTIGFAKKSAEEFFELLREAGIRTLIDIRLNNTSQLAGFTKKGDITYFLKEICDADYIHETRLAPTQEILDDYKKKQITWEEYEERFIELLSGRNVEECIDRDVFNNPTVLLCSESSPKRCHRRLVSEYLKEKWGDVDIVHI